MAICGSENVVFKHKYITNPSVMPDVAIVHAVKQLTSVLQGNTPPPLVQSGLDQIKKLTKIFDSTKEEYEKRDEAAPTLTNNSNSPVAAPPRVPSATPPRVRSSRADPVLDLV